MNAALKVAANESFPLSVYGFNLKGPSAAELAQAYSLPVTWVEERIDAACPRLKFQVKLAVSHTGNSATTCIERVA